MTAYPCRVGGKMSRLTNLRKKLQEKELDAMLVLGAANRRYMSGFTGSAGTLVISQDAAVLITDFRYIEQATAQAPQFQVRRYEDYLTTVKEVLDEYGCRRVGFESDIVTYDQYTKWQEKLEEIEWVPAPGLVEGLRMVKSDEEIACIEKAAAIGDEAWSELLPHMRPGVTEKDLALELEFLMRQKGAEALAFDIILASGPNGALPHAVPSHRPLQEGDLVVMDFGARVNGYCSDMTRTVVIGKACQRSRTLYNIVLDAQRAAVAAVKAGKTGKEIDAVARGIIADAGYGEYFGHGFGHSLGIEIHEPPNASATETSVLPKGAVISAEPGIYIPGQFGVRIEDVLILGEDGCENITKAKKELIIL